MGWPKWSCADAALGTRASPSELLQRQTEPTHPVLGYGGVPGGEQEGTEGWR